MSSPKLDIFAKMIARRFPPTLAAKCAGFPDLRRSRAEARLDGPDIEPGIGAPPSPAEQDVAVSRSAATKRPTAMATPAPEVAEPPPPPLKPMMTNAEWLAKYAPRPAAE